MKKQKKNSLEFMKSCKLKNKFNKKLNIIFHFNKLSLNLRVLREPCPRSECSKMDTIACSRTLPLARKSFTHMKNMLPQEFKYYTNITHKLNCHNK